MDRPLWSLSAASPSRREFLKSSTLLGLTALAGPRWALAADEPATPLDMTIARWSGRGEAPKSLAAQLTEKAILELGGMGRFVKKSDVVWVKPNIGWNRRPEQAANTHPDVVGALVKLCLEAGAKKVKVGDYTCNDAKASYENSGVGPAARAAGAEIVYVDTDRFRQMKIGGARLKDHPVYPEMVECDLLISVPVCKHHGSTNVSLAMKNYMGCVDDRGTFHQDLPTTIADITQFFKPRLAVLDATRALLRHGPTGGDVKDVKTLHCVAAGVDIVALDAFGSELLGNKPAEIETVTAGAKYGLGKLDYKSLKLKELSLS
jgi:uncharacterized protein (DUF362 family)